MRVIATHFFILGALLTSISCSKNSHIDISSLPTTSSDNRETAPPPTDNETDTDANNGNQDDGNQDDDSGDDTTPTEPPTFYFHFDLLTGTCHDSAGILGYNPIGPAECSDMENKDLGTKDITQCDCSGSNFKGTYLQDAIFDLYKMTAEEVQFSLDTIFPESFENPFTQIAQYSKDIALALGVKIREYTNQINILTRANKSIEKDLKKDPDNEELLAQYEANLKEIEELNQKILYAEAQKSRQLDFFSLYKAMATEYSY